jgi:hypothetical protein
MKLTLRDLLWLVLVVAVAFGWLHSDRRRAAELQSTVDRHNKYLDQWRADTDETLKSYRKAAFDSPGYREWIQQRDRDLASFRDFLDERNRVSAGEDGQRASSTTANAAP